MVSFFVESTCSVYANAVLHSGTLWINGFYGEFIIYNLYIYAHLNEHLSYDHDFPTDSIFRLVQKSLFCEDYVKSVQ